MRADSSLKCRPIRGKRVRRRDTMPGLMDGEIDIGIVRELASSSKERSLPFRANLLFGEKKNLAPRGGDDGNFFLPFIRKESLAQKVGKGLLSRHKCSQL